MTDRFRAITAQLETIENQIERDQTHQLQTLLMLKAALEEIMAIRQDDRGNGLALAFKIAQKALDDAGQRL